MPTTEKKSTPRSLHLLLRDIRSCRECEAGLPLGPRPIVSVHAESRILIIGQAPGTKVHESGVPWDDASGERLRDWLGTSSDQFYDERLFGLMPMGFCYPGRGKSGDLPPRKECQPLWHPPLLKHMKKVQLTILIGRYAQQFYLPDSRKQSLTAVVRDWRSVAPSVMPLPHPSPRNNIWLARNEWFEADLVPALRTAVARALAS